MRGWPVVALLCACGRVGFDSTREAGSDSAIGPTLLENQVALGVGGEARRVRVTGPGLSSFYVLYGRNRLLYSDDAGETLQDCGELRAYVTAFDADASGRVVVSSSNGLYESTDRCRTFSVIGFAGTWVNTVRLDGGTLYALPAAGLRRYEGGGAWTPIPSALDGTYAQDMLPGTVKLLAGNGTVGMLRSTDGVTWNASNGGLLPSTGILRLTRVGSSIWAATTTGLYESVDDGVSWTSRHAGWADMIAVDPGDPTFIAHWWASGYTISKTGGGTWSDMTDPMLARSRVNDAEFDPGGSGVAIVASGRGLFAMDRSLALRELARNVDGWTVSKTAVDGVSTRYLATSAGVIRMPADGAAYTLTDTSAPGYSQVNDIVPFNGAMYASGRSIARSDDDGATYSEVYEPDQTDAYRVGTLAAAGNTLLAITDGRVLRSTDGATWVGPMVPLSLGNTLAAVPGAPSKVIAGADQQGIFVSVDGGGTFAQASTTRSIYDLLPMPDGSVLVATGNGILRAATPAGPYAAYSLAGDMVSSLTLRGTTVFATSDDSIVKSTDGGMTFQPVAGFGGRAPISLEVDAPTGDLLVGTNGWGLFRIPNP